MCHHCEKGEGRKTDIVCSTKETKRVPENQKKEGEGTRVEEYEIKEAREDATVRRNREKEFIRGVLVVYTSSCVLFSSFFLLFSLSFVLVLSREREISQCLVPVFVYLSRLAVANGEKLHYKRYLEEKINLYIYT